MLWYAGVVLVLILPLTLLLKPAPLAPGDAVGLEIRVARAPAAPVAWPAFIPTLVQALICVAGFCCCVPMAVPAAHIVAFCGDIGIRRPMVPRCCR